jgi:hypothetical protein
LRQLRERWGGGSEAWGAGDLIYGVAAAPRERGRGK